MVSRRPAPGASAVKEPRLSTLSFRQMFFDIVTDDYVGGSLADHRRRCWRQSRHGALVMADTWAFVVATSGCGGCINDRRRL